MVGLMSLFWSAALTRGEEEAAGSSCVRSLPVGRARAARRRRSLVVAGMNVVARRARRACASCCRTCPSPARSSFGASFTVFGLLVRRHHRRHRAGHREHAGRLRHRRRGARRVVRAPGRRRHRRRHDLVALAHRLGAEGPAVRRRAWWPLLLCVVLGGGLAWVGHGPGRPPRLRRRAGRTAAGAGAAAAVARAARSGWPSGCSGARSSGGRPRCSLSGLAYGSMADSIDDFVDDNQALADIIAAAGASEPHRLLPRHVAADHGPRRRRSARSRSCCGCAPRRPAQRAEIGAGHADVAVGPGWGATSPSPSAGSALMLVAGGLGLGLAYAVVGGDCGQVPRLLAAGLVYVPAVWLLAALAVALFGAGPPLDRRRLGWSLGGCLVIGMFGTLLDLPAVGARPLAVPARAPGAGRPPAGAPARRPHRRGRRADGARLRDVPLHRDIVTA